MKGSSQGSGTTPPAVGREPLPLRGLTHSPHFIPSSFSINYFPPNPVFSFLGKAWAVCGSCSLCLTKLIIEKALEPREAAFSCCCRSLGQHPLWKAGCPKARDQVVGGSSYRLRPECRLEGVGAANLRSGGAGLPPPLPSSSQPRQGLRGAESCY